MGFNKLDDREGLIALPKITCLRGDNLEILRSFAEELEVNKGPIFRFIISCEDYLDPWFDGMLNPDGDILDAEDYKKLEILRGETHLLWKRILSPSYRIELIWKSFLQNGSDSYIILNADEEEKSFLNAIVRPWNFLEIEIFEGRDYSVKEVPWNRLAIPTYNVKLIEPEIRNHRLVEDGKLHV